jgi:5'-3' exoribonuclease 1
MIDSNSPLLSFYPEDFQLDQNEKKHDWESIVLLPFIDEELLLNSITKYYPQLDPIEQNRNRHILSSCFTTTSKLQPIGNSLRPNLYFPALKETRAICREFHIDHYDIKHGRFEEKEMVNFPKFPILNVLPYKFGYKNSAVSLFESRSRETTLVLSLNHRPDSDYIKYNNQWNPKDENPSSPFQIASIHLLIERYLGKRVFVNWPHFQYGIVCAISDFQHIYAWSNIPGGSSFYSEPINPDENPDSRNYVPTPIYVSYYPFEIFNDTHRKATYDTYTLNEIETQVEYTKAININRYYENRQGVSIGPIPILLYVSPFIGYRTKFSSNSEKSRIATCFSNQALAYPLQTTLFKLPNYRDDFEKIPQMINDYFKINDSIFALQSPYYSSLGHVQQINQDNHGKYFISCQMESSDVVNQPDIHYLASKLYEHQLKYFTAQQIAERLKIIPCVVSKITGKINVLAGNKRRKRVNPTNIGLSWKINKPVKQVNTNPLRIRAYLQFNFSSFMVIRKRSMRFGIIRN